MSLHSDQNPTFFLSKNHHSKCQAVTAADEPLKEDLQAGETSETEKELNRFARKIQSCSGDPFLGKVFWKLKEKDEFMSTPNILILSHSGLFSNPKTPKYIV
ncbi:hypothetical protein XENORESO_013406 [Xenotaenia resolanae]|uniref:Uncharacterized protein n=1 Tax=Xenotaenia resolanae TaxID=208358 RepID=A0ABV0VSV5_9TELE